MNLQITPYGNSFGFVTWNKILNTLPAQTKFYFIAVITDSITYTPRILTVAKTYANI